MIVCITCIIYTDNIHDNNEAITYHSLPITGLHTNYKPVIAPFIAYIIDYVYIVATNHILSIALHIVLTSLDTTNYIHVGSLAYSPIV